MAPIRATSARLGRAALLTLAAGVLAVAAGGCSLLGDDEDPAAAPPSGVGGIGPAPAATATAGAADDQAGDSGDGSGNGSGSGSGNGSGSGSGNGNGSDAGGANPGDSGPAIAYFRVKQKPTCPRGTNLNPIAGSPLVIEWKVTGARQVELAVDGPGAYNTYGPEGSETFTFSCGGAPGTVEKHTYKLTTLDGGAARSKTIGASATVNEIPVVG